MKKITLAICAMLLLSGAALKAEGSSTRFFLGGTVAMPLGPEEWSDYATPGFGVIAGLEFPMQGDATNILQLEGQFTMFGLKKDKLKEVWGAPDDLDLSGGETTAITLFGNFKKQLNPVYVLAGIGFYSSSITDVEWEYEGSEGTEEAPDGESGMALQFGAGVELGSEGQFFIQGKYSIHMAEEDNASLMTFNAGMKF